MEKGQKNKGNSAFVRYKYNEKAAFPREAAKLI